METESKQPIHAALAIIVHDRKVLICRRPEGKVYAGYWEFPGGKIEPGESPEQCAAREVREEVGLVVEPIQPLQTIDHTYPHGQVRLHPFICRYISGTIQFIDCADARWIDPIDFPNYKFPEANEPIIQHVTQYVENTTIPRR